MVGCYQNGQRFAFRQNEYILRTSSINGGGTDGKYNERYIVYLTIELTVGIVGIVVTIISIIVTVISILQNETDRRSRHQKSNRHAEMQVAFFTVTYNQANRCFTVAPSYKFIIAFCFKLVNPVLKFQIDPGMIFCLFLINIKDRS